MLCLHQKKVITIWANNPDNKYIIPNIGNTWTMIDDMVLCYTAEDDYNLKWLLDGYYRAYPQTIPTNITNGGEDTIQINNVNANDLMLLFDVGKDGDQNSNLENALYIFKRSNRVVNSVYKQAYGLFNKYRYVPSSNMVEINDFFDNTNNKTDNVKYGANRIEHIIVTNKGGVIKELDVEGYITKVRSLMRDDVFRWVGKYYSTVSDILFNADTREYAFTKTLESFKIPIDLTIKGTAGNNKFYAEVGSDTFVFDGEGGRDTIYGANFADTIQISGNNIEPVLTKIGNNLYIKYYDNGYTDKRGRWHDTSSVITLSNYYKTAQGNRLDTYTVNGTQHTISNEIINVTGLGKIYGTSGSDTITGSRSGDRIYGGYGGVDEIFGDWGNDIIYSQSQTGSAVFIAGEEGNDRLYAGAGVDYFYFGEAEDKGEGRDTIYNADSNDKIRFANISADDLKYTKSGNNLIITTPNAKNFENETARKSYRNFSATVANYFNPNISDESKIDTVEFGDKNSANTSISIKEQTINVGGKGRIYGTKYKDNIVGSRYSDRIYTGVGEDTVTAGRGNDTIYITGEGNKTLNFNSGDGKDTVVIGKGITSAINLKFNNLSTDALSYSKSVNDLVITQTYLDKRNRTKFGGNVTIKNYFNENDGSIKYNNINVTTDEGTSDIQTLLNNNGLTVTAGTYDRRWREPEYTGTKYNDTFNYKSGNAVIYGGEGNDTYNIKMTNKTNVYMSDCYDNTNIGGGNDTLNIDAKQNNLALLFNVDRNGNILEYDSALNDEHGIDTLFVFNKKSLTLNNINRLFREQDVGGLIQIDGYFEENSENNHDPYGYIENINIKDNSGKNYVSANIDSWIQGISQDVASWMSDHSAYSSTIDVFNQGNKADINSLLKVYANYQPQQ